MESNGIMQEIRTLLSQGKSSGQVISLGFKPSTTYKVQRQLRRGGQGAGRISAPGTALPPADTTAFEPEPGLEAENIRLQQEVEALEGQLECVVDGYAELNAEIRTVQEREKTLATEAAASGQLRQRVKELEGQLEHAGHTQAAMRQVASQWQQKYEAEQVARQEAEGKARGVRRGNQQIREELEKWQQTAAEAYAVLQSLIAEVEALRPLKVWAAHPCTVCHQPMTGLVDRGTAAKLMKDFGHNACLEKQGSSLGGWLLAGGATVYALSQLSKK